METVVVLPPTVEHAVDRYLADLDQHVPGAVTAFYVVGSVALGAFVEGRSDIDFVAVVDDGTGDAEVAELRRLHLRHGLRTALDALRHGRSPLTGTCNGLFVRAADLATPVTELRAVASQVGHTFRLGGGGSDLSPVGWKVLAERGIPVRGPSPSELPLDPQPHLLRPWNLDNLEAYWRPWAEAAPGSLRFRLRPRWCTAWGVLGPLRLHHTIATGDVIAKERAGDWGLEVLPASRHVLVREALAYRRGEPSTVRLSAAERARQTSELALEVIDLSPA